MPFTRLVPLVRTFVIGHLLCGWATISFASTLDGVMHWNRGDSVAGALHGADDQCLQWKSPRFPGAFDIDWRYLSSIEFASTQRADAAAGPFRLTTVNGDVLFGDVRDIDQENIRFTSQRHGEVALRRDFLREIKQLRHAEVLYDGPRWLDGWQVLKAGRRLSEWRPTEHGFLSTKTYGGEIYHPLPDLELAEINLALRWSGKPSFHVDFSSAGELLAQRPRLSIRTWSDDVVAQTSLNTVDFRHLVKLDERKHELRLRIVWNRESGEIAISNQSGNLLGEILTSQQAGSPGFGILVKNRGENLTITQVRVSRWNGVRPSADRQPGADYLRLADGQLITQPIVGYDQAQRALLVGDEQPRRIPIERLAVAEFRSDVAREPQRVHIRFQDGNELVGNLLGMDGSTMSVQIPSADEMMSVRTDGLQELRFLDGLTADPADTPFRLGFADGQQLQGMVASVDGSEELGWRPVGSQNATALPHVPFVIERGPDAPRLPPAEQPREMLFLRDGSSLAGHIIAIDQQFVQFQSDCATETRIPSDQVKALEVFEGSGRISFASSRWDFLRQTNPLQRSFEALEVDSTVSFRDLSLQHDGKLTLGCSWDDGFVGLLTIHLGASTNQPRTSIARFTIKQDRISARCLQQPVSYRELPPVPRRQATISLRAEGKALSVWVNGILAFETQLRVEIARQGLWIQCGSASPLLSRSPDQQRKQPRLVLDGLRVGDGAGVANIGFVDESQKRMLLRLPRGREKDIPRNVLCAKNGDLLRGTLLRVDDKQIHFRSRLADVRLPRDQLAAVVWLYRPGDTAPSVNGEGTSKSAEATPEPSRQRHRFALRDGTLLVLRDAVLQGDQVVGSHPLLGACRIALASIVKFRGGEMVSWLGSDPFADWALLPARQPDFQTGAEGQGLGEQGVDSPLLNQHVEDVSVLKLDGVDFNLQMQRGKVIVLSFWATWSAPCIRSIPELQRAVAKFPAEDVALLAINQEEAPETIEPFLESRGWDIPVGLDLDGRWSAKFLVDTLPQTVVIDREGRVERVFVGVPAGLIDGVERCVESLLAGESTRD